MQAKRRISEGFSPNTASVLLTSRKPRFVLTVCLLRGLVGLLVLAALLNLSSVTPLPFSPSSVPTVLGKLPLYFIENRGQTEAQVAYYVQGRDTTLYFTPRGVTFVLNGKKERPAVPDLNLLQPVALGADIAEESTRHRWVLKLDFVGANPNVQPQGQDLTPALVSYFRGPREQWQTSLPTYRRIVYSDLWPGIDLIYSGTATHLKYTFMVKPGADPNQIQLAYRGAAAVTLTDAGQLEVHMPGKSISDERPSAYQEEAGRQIEVAAAYALAGDPVADSYVYGFRVGSYDQNKLLVLDPAVLLYAGYIGGSGDDEGHGIAVDSTGDAYITGSTTSTVPTFPVLVGPDLTDNGEIDAFVAKVKADGSGLIYAGYIGGSDNDSGQGIAVDSTGNAYVVGTTSSTAATFPVLVGPDLTENGGQDTFVAKVDATGTNLLYAGYIGGSGADLGRGITVNSKGNAYVTGSTTSTAATFPVLVGPDLTENGGQDAFVAKVKANGAKLVYAGYIGGNGTDVGRGIALDSTGKNAYVTGSTTSAADTFPVLVGPDLTENGGTDAFVAKVSADGTGLAYAGYIGGDRSDEGDGIVVDSTGNAYVVGTTTSAETSFPVLVGPDLTYNGNRDAFVVEVSADGTGFVYAGYIGGSASDEGRGIAVNDKGNAYVVGTTSSAADTFPVLVGPDLTYNGEQDAFVAKVKANGAKLVYAGYIGGNGTEEGRGIALDSKGKKAYVVGTTSSTADTFPVLVGPDLIDNGGTDAFVAKISGCCGATGP